LLFLLWLLFFDLFRHYPNLDDLFGIVEVMPCPDLRGAVKPLGLKKFYGINDLFCLVLFLAVG
jgi:hypothetical protein